MSTMKSLKNRLKRHEVTIDNKDWSKYDERLLKVVESGELDKVTATLAKKGVVPTKLNPQGHSAFHEAAERGDERSLSIFLTHGADVRATNGSGKTALHLAAKAGHTLCMQTLLQSNCSIDATDLQGRTAVHDAVLAGSVSSVKLLCSRGASINSVDMDGITPLTLAAQMCQAGVCHLLLEAGAALNHRDKQNKTPLMRGCEAGSKEVVEALLKARADVTAQDAQGHDAFHYARLTQDQQLIIMLKNALDAAYRAKEVGKTSQRAPQVKLPSSGVEWTGGGGGGGGADMMKDRAPPAELHAAKGGPLLPGAVPRPAVRPGEAFVGEVEALRWELREVRRRQEVAEEEALKLRAVLSQREAQHEEQRRSGELALQEAHGRSWQLEEALREVQRRMVGSEARVRQMQAHLMAVRENVVEELRVQLHEAAAQREEARGEAVRLHRELSLSRRRGEEQRGREEQLAEEVQRLRQQLDRAVRDRKEVNARLAQAEVSLRGKDLDATKKLLSDAMGRQIVKLRQDQGTASQTQEVGSMAQNATPPQETNEESTETQSAISPDYKPDEAMGAGSTTSLRDEEASIEQSATSLLHDTRKEDTGAPSSTSLPLPVSRDSQASAERQEPAAIWPPPPEDHVPRAEHEALRSALSASLEQAEAGAQEALRRCQGAREEADGLLRELQEQRAELDTIQEALQARFVPLVVLEEKERELAQLREVVQEREKAMMEEKEKATLKEKELAQLREALQEREKTMMEEKEKATIKEEELVQLREVVQEREKAKMEEKEREVTVLNEQEKELTLLRLTLQEREQAAQEGEEREVTALSAKERELAQVRRTLQEREQAMMEEKEAHKAALDEKERELTDLRGVLQEREMASFEKEQEQVQLRQTLQDREQAMMKEKERELAELRGVLQEREMASFEKEQAQVQLRLTLIQEQKRRAGDEEGEASGGGHGDQEARAEDEEQREISDAPSPRCGVTEGGEDQQSRRPKDTRDTHTQVPELQGESEGGGGRLAAALSPEAAGWSEPGHPEPRDISSLRAQIYNLEQQLEESERHHRNILSMYRTRLLNAAQGHMDEDARAALLQISVMRRECVC
ncbi:ankyrin repeat domain-containing protein 24 isoform X2 [Clupea harengus]|uniref:Ankyrin repeat domain-containing protein 24 isoform X2 n=1 Tax=Clupea harengus TaxID=7950 RepID=A0A6P8EWL8_CLUHA|nr:ankyrin repeat domain-containing protein 24 isoform X2 [Clupea harengus]